MDGNQILLDGCDVILFCDDGCTQLNGVLTLVSRFIKTGYVSTGKMQPPIDALFLDEGVRCVVLQPHGDGWQKGTLKFRLEFTPEETISQPNKTDAVMSSPVDEMYSKYDEFGSSEIA